MSDNEYIAPLEQARVMNVFTDAINSVKASNIPSRIESQSNQTTKAHPAKTSTGVQNTLIYLLLMIAKQLGLKENELEKVFDEVLKMVSTYKNKKAES